MRAQHIVGFAFVGAFALVALGRADAPPGRYTIANGTVYDTKTRLTWELSVAASTFSWSDAGLYCGSIALGGAAWRVPTPKELSTLIDDSRYGPGIDLTAFPGTPVANFWTSTIARDSSAAAWFVSFDQGEASSAPTSSAFRVRCVH